jgi:hypothetical protein
MPPENAPSWAYIEQPDMIYDTEYSEKTAEEGAEEAGEDDDIEEVVIIDSMEIEGGSKSGSFMHVE